VPILTENTGVSITNIKHLILFQETITSFFSITQKNHFFFSITQTINIFCEQNAKFLILKFMADS